MSPTRYPIALSGVVGSTAYGLAREGSDVDRLGIYVAPTRGLLGLEKVVETVHSAGPDQPADHTFHEVGKFVRLAGVCNPTVLELLFLPEDLIEVCDRDGRLLRENRSVFLSASWVRSAHAGYAHQQAEKLAARADGTFSSDTRNRTAKHARHCFRLLRNGAQLLSTGDLTLRVPDPEAYFAFDHMPVTDILARFDEEEARFLETAQSSVLPEDVDWAAVTDLLLRIRDRHYRRGTGMAGLVNRAVEALPRPGVATVTIPEKPKNADKSQPKQTSEVRT